MVFPTVNMLTYLLNLFISLLMHWSASLSTLLTYLPLPCPQLSIQLQQSSEYWSDKVRDLSNQLEKTRSSSSIIGKAYWEAEHFTTHFTSRAFDSSTHWYWTSHSVLFQLFHIVPIMIQRKMMLMLFSLKQIYLGLILWQWNGSCSLIANLFADSKFKMCSVC